MLTARGEPRTMGVLNDRALASAAPDRRVAGLGLGLDTAGGVVVAVLAVGAVSLVIRAILGATGFSEELPLLYIPAVLAVAAVFGRGPGLVAAVLSSLAYEFFFGAPPFSFAVDGLQDWLGLFVFLTTALVAGGLSAALRQQARSARQREREATVLHRLDRLLVGVDGSEQAVDAACGLLAAELGAAVRIHLGAMPRSGPVDAAPGACVLPLGADDHQGWLEVNPVEAPFQPGPSRFLAAAADQVGSALERVRLRAAAAEADALRRSDELKTSLVNSVSHEMRTPLAAIKAAAGSLAHVDLVAEERRGLAQGIEREADRLNRIVDNLLDLSRIEGGALRPRKELHPVPGVVDDVLARLRDRGGRDVVVDVPEDLPPVPLDYVQIEQVLTNLLENGFRHTPPGTVVRLSASVIPGAVRVAVSDHGPGVPSADLPRLFDKFYRVGSGRASGAGLGLAVVKGLVEAHGGQVGADGAPGQGLTVWFTLPLETSGGEAS